MKRFLVILSLISACLNFCGGLAYSDVDMAGKYKFIIIHKSDGYYLDSKKIDNKVVENLLVVINEPVIEKLDFTQFGINQPWLNENATLALDEYISYYPYIQPSGEQKKLFSDSFKNLPLVNKALRSYYESAWTDDYPQFSLEIIDTDGKVINLYSDSQHIFMIPWRITKDGQTIKTFNVRISNALITILPKDFPDRDHSRISGAYIKRIIADEILHQIEIDWDKLGSEQRIGKEIAVIKDKYILKTSAIEWVSSIDLYGGESWNATLTRKDLPSNVMIGISIPFVGGKLESLESFLKKSDYYIDLVLYVPWFIEYLKNNPEAKAEIRFVKDKSISERATESFTEDMRNNGKTDFLQKISNLLKDSSFLEITENNGNYSRWIVLPDKRMILWHFEGNKVLKWNLSQFKTWDYLGHNSVGAVFSPQGTIESGN